MHQRDPVMLANLENALDVMFARCDDTGGQPFIPKTLEEGRARRALRAFRKEVK